jgi:hypothetical protein
MPSPLDHIQTITQHFVDTWNDDVPVIFDNQPNAARPATTWGRFSIVLGANRRRTYGATATYIQQGRVYLQIFVPAATGLESGYVVANSFIAAFRDWRSADYQVRFLQHEFTVMEPEDGGWFNITVSFPFEFLEG